MSENDRLKRKHDFLVENGLLEPDEPTEWAHKQHIDKMQAEFAPVERHMIRCLVLED